MTRPSLDNLLALQKSAETNPVLYAMQTRCFECIDTLLNGAPDDKNALKIGIVLHYTPALLDLLGNGYFQSIGTAAASMAETLTNPKFKTQSLKEPVPKNLAQLSAVVIMVETERQKQDIPHMRRSLAESWMSDLKSAHCRDITNNIFDCAQSEKIKDAYQSLHADALRAATEHLGRAAAPARKRNNINPAK